jgi:hypothetical protein
MGMACHWFVILSLILSSQLLPAAQVQEIISLKVTYMYMSSMFDVSIMG